MTRYKNYLLSLLTLIFAFNCVDRLALGVLLQDIKIDLVLSDTQLGFLSGIAFALFYAVMGIPIARWADRGDRVVIISLTAALWSAAVALCGFAASFAQLLLIRIVVAVGEAGCIPPAHSLIADHFSRAERPRAVARYMLGAPLAFVIGNAAAGWINQFYGWRVAFMSLGVPGLVLAGLAALTLREPRRQGSAPPQGEDRAGDRHHQPQPAADSGGSFSQVLGVLWANAPYRHLVYCFSVWGFFGFGLMQWQPAFFVRSHGLDTGTLGTWFAVVVGVGGLLGTYLGGEVAARYAANNERLQLVGIAIVYSSLAVFCVGIYLVPDHRVAFAILGVSNIFAAAANGPLFAVTQTLVPPRMRAMSIALMYLFCNLLGMGLGPLAVGALSDTLRPSLGEESLRYALLAFSPGYLWCGWHLWRASRHVPDAASAQEDPLKRDPVKVGIADLRRQVY